MSITIQTRGAMGQRDIERFEAEIAAWNALEQKLGAHRDAGHQVMRDGNTYLVIDRLGTFVEESVVVRAES